MRDLPNMDQNEEMSHDGDTTDPFVRIRVKDIETGEVFIRIDTRD